METKCNCEADHPKRIDEKEGGTLLWVVFTLLCSLELCFRTSSTEIQWCRKGMVRELKVLHKNPETSYVEEGFSGI